MLTVIPGSASRSLGLLAMALERWDEADDHLGSALEFNRAIGAAPWVARTHVARADLLVRRGRAGDDEAAQAELSAARAIGEELGLTQVLEASRRPGGAGAPPAR